MDRNTRPHRSRLGSRGFSLVELMVVIGIIALLIGIALPAFSQAKTTAKVATTTATLNAISTGLESFRADEKLGGEYPPSQYVNLLHNPQLPPGSPDVNVGGASLAVYALAGGDLLGSAGIRDANGTTVNPNAPWADDLSAETKAPLGLYRKNNAGGPAVARTSFVDISKMKWPTWNSVSKEFVVPAGKAPMKSIAFLDSFDQPILYYRANLGRTALASPYLAGNPRDYGIYRFSDNANITGDPTGNVTGVSPLDFGAGQGQFSKGFNKGDFVDLLNPGLRDGWRGTFCYTIFNPSVTASPQPHNAETYILLSAGPDGLFGTEDDVANFPTNK